MSVWDWMNEHAPGKNPLDYFGPLGSIVGWITGKDNSQSISGALESIPVAGTGVKAVNKITAGRTASGNKKQKKAKPKAKTSRVRRKTSAKPRKKSSSRQKN